MIDDDALTTADLEYITTDASVFVGLDASSCWLDEVTESTNEQLEMSALAGYSHGPERVSTTKLSFVRLLCL